MNCKLIMTIFLSLLTYSVSGFGQVVVIANKSVPVDTLEKAAVLDLYTGDIRKWNDGQSVVVLDLKSKSEVSKNFYKFLGKSSSRMKSIWLKRMLSGEGEPPILVNSEEELLKKVASTPGAIGYVSQVKVNKEVKILLPVGEVKR